MGYKYKPNKGMKKRFKVTATGKLTRGHTMRSHLQSSRPATKRRKLRKLGLVHEGHSKNLREFMGLKKTRPGKIKHARAVKAAAARKSA